jgi:di/tricarboxylate transporter
MAFAGLTTPALVVFALIGVALALFVSEVIPNDITAIGVIVALAAIQPVVGLNVGITPRDAISGFANPATITIFGMYMLSAGIQQKGLGQRLGV